MSNQGNQNDKFEKPKAFIKNEPKYISKSVANTSTIFPFPSSLNYNPIWVEPNYPNRRQGLNNHGNTANTNNDSKDVINSEKGEGNKQSIGLKRKMERVSVPDDVGYLPPTEVVLNGSFKKQISTNPQKMVFLTYKTDTDNYYDCKLPLKINIPGGDFGLYRVTVNEVLFRNDAPILEYDDYVDLHFESDLMAKCEIYKKATDENESEEANKVGEATSSFKIPISNKNIRIGFPSHWGTITLDYLTNSTLCAILNLMINSISTPIGSFSGSTCLPTIIDDGISITPVILETDSVPVLLKNIFKVYRNEINGIGGVFGLLSDTNIDVSMFYGEEDLNEKYTCKLTDISASFSLSASSNFRHIIPVLSTKEREYSTKIHIPNLRNNIISEYTGLNVPYFRFGGAMIYMFNTSAQTTCPIGNEYAKQFNTCALSYNTDISPMSLVQMTSNIELTLKEGSEFRVWLTDNYGTPIKIRSPVYVQVTVEPFNNE